MQKGNMKLFSLPFARRGGQILIPSLLVIPSLLLFVYLLFETTKISREKIRQQFATDSAAFIQMGDYTNLLNRTAYVNGAFPYRIFKEAFDCPGPDGTNKKLKKSDDSGEVCAYKMLYEAGGFPKHKDDHEGEDPISLDGNPKWEIDFDSSRTDFYNKNPGSQINVPLFTMITRQQGINIMVWFKEQGIGYYKFYSQVYSLLGSVEESQYIVFERLTTGFNFFRKSYYLNANTQECVSNPQACGEDGISRAGGTSFNATKLTRDVNFYMHYVLELDFWGKVPASFPVLYDIGHANPALKMTNMDPKGLFQLATAKDSILTQLGKGIDVYQGWDAPSNFFKVDFNTIAKCNETGRPCVHSMVTTQCPAMPGNNCVWPNPTPKYQTRLYP